MNDLKQTCIILSLLIIASGLHIQFDTVSTLFLPYTYSPSPQYKLAKDAAEQMAYDSQSKIIYSVGYTNIHVIDISNVKNPQTLFHMSYENVDATDVEFCGGFVFVAFDNQTVREDGFVDVFKGYNKISGSLDHVNRIIVGDIPDMIHPIRDCSKVIVAIEAEPYIDVGNDRLVDNPGGVGVISFEDSPSGAFSYKVVDFKKFNARFAELEKTGVRWIYRDSNSFSNDIEPEYIAFNADESKAYICLQENNAIAVFDMKTEQIEEIYGLGFKQWNSSELDPSDKDGGIHMKSWPVYGIYQPDSIKFYTHNKVDYIITANEGDTKHYIPKFSEEERVANIQLSELFESNATVRAQLQENAQLGRLKITTQNGKNAETGKYDKIYTFGGRGFSIRRADTMELVYDSGSEIERKTSLLHSTLFNNNYEENETVANSMDSRSDDKGPETESITIGHFGDVTLLMVGNERPGAIAIYTIDERLSTIEQTFHTLLSGILRTNDTWENLYERREISMLDPEDMRFIQSEESPNGRPLLVVSGSTSGTISIIEVTLTQDHAVKDGTGSAAVSSISKALLMVYMGLLMLW